MTTVVIQREEQDVLIPPWVTDLEAFRRWAKSDEFPRHGSYAHLDGQLWVDPSMEKLRHNQIKTEVSNVIGPLVKASTAGLFISDRMLLTNTAVGLSTDPDGMFIAYDALKSGRAVLEDAEESLEVLGVPDMVLEVVSRSSFRKDTVLLRELYHRAGVPEYWLADSRERQNFGFQVLHHGPAGYVQAADRQGWQESKVLGRSFRLLCEIDPVGLPVFRLEMN